MNDDEKKLRKDLGLPLTKDLQYVKDGKIYKVTDLQIVEIYQPSGTPSLLITLEDGTQKRILAPFFAEMQ